MNLNFLHPRISTAFKADVDATTTGETCIQGLIDAKFIDAPPQGRPYSLVVTRNQKQILPTTTMQEAGVMPGDSLAVLQMEQGAKA
jgi:hypothetical protein